MFPFFNDLYSSSPQGSSDQKNQKDLISAGCDYCPVKAVIAHIRQTKTSLFFLDIFASLPCPWESTWSEKHQENDEKQEVFDDSKRFYSHNRDQIVLRL